MNYHYRELMRRRRARMDDRLVEAIRRMDEACDGCEPIRTWLWGGVSYPVPDVRSASDLSPFPSHLPSAEPEARP
jgi:hypothetical protein